MGLVRMSNFEITWLQEKRVLEATIPPKIGLRESALMNRDLTISLAASTAGRVHMLLDVSELQMTQMNIALLSTVLMPLTLSQACGWILLYGTEKSIHQLFYVSSIQGTRRRFRTDPSREAALAWLQTEVTNLNLSTGV